MQVEPSRSTYSKRGTPPELVTVNAAGVAWLTSGKLVVTLEEVTCGAG
jgi:hypothetical protein